MDEELIHFIDKTMQIHEDKIVRVLELLHKQITDLRERVKKLEGSKYINA